VEHSWKRILRRSLRFRGPSSTSWTSRNEMSPASFLSSSSGGGVCPSNWWKFEYTICSTRPRREAMIIAASRVSRKTMKKMGTEKRLRAMVSGEKRGGRAWGKSEDKCTSGRVQRTVSVWGRCLVHLIRFTAAIKISTPIVAHVTVQGRSVPWTVGNDPQVVVAAFRNLIMPRDHNRQGNYQISDDRKILSDNGMLPPTRPPSHAPLIWIPQSQSISNASLSKVRLLPLSIPPPFYPHPLLPLLCIAPCISPCG